MKHPQSASEVKPSKFFAHLNSVRRHRAACAQPLLGEKRKRSDKTKQTKCQIFFHGSSLLWRWGLSSKALTLGTLRTCLNSYSIVQILIKSFSGLGRFFFHRNEKFQKHFGHDYSPQDFILGGIIKLLLSVRRGVRPSARSQISEMAGWNWMIFWILVKNYPMQVPVFRKFKKFQFWPF